MRSVGEVLRSVVVRCWSWLAGWCRLGMITCVLVRGVSRCPGRWRVPGTSGGRPPARHWFGV